MLRLTTYLLLALVVAAALASAAFAAAEYTGRSAFCRNCHEMNPYDWSWSQSQHRDTPCVECHIPPGTVNLIKTKAFSFREIWVHLTGQVQAPLAVTREIPNESCTTCHEELPSRQLESTTFNHGTHAQRCISCHRRLTHRSVTPPEYVDPATMDACLVCHDGTQADGACAVCHSAPHEDMGADCEKCHTLNDWMPSGFEHPVALEGAHASLECSACHSPQASADQVFELGKTLDQCRQCHTDPHGGPPDCARCHTVKGWESTTFRHPSTGEHSVGGGGPSCRECHPDGFGSVSCTCHGGNVPQDD